MGITKIIFILFFALIFCENINSQIFPSYKERSFLSDSLFTDFYNIEASDGSVDPEEYILGPGDKLFIAISGIEDLTYNLVVNQEGYLFIPKVGGIDLDKKTLAGGKKEIIDAVNKFYKNVDVFISLVDFRKLKVALLGEVKKPSSYVVISNSRLIDLITSSPGLTEESNYRNIMIKSKNGEENRYDFLKFLRFGIKEENPLLQDGDVVLIDKIDEVVAISGMVNYPGTYEYVEGETVEQLIELAGGFTSKASKDTIELVRFTENGKTQRSIYLTDSQIDSEKITLNSRDHILVREIPEYLIPKFVEISGFVRYPGYYKIIEDKTTLYEIINEAGGFLDDASLTEATLTRSKGIDTEDPEFERLKSIPRADMTEDEYDYLKSVSRQRKGRVVVDFVKLFENKNMFENVVLKRGDEIVIPEAKNFIIMLGQVVNPGNIIYKSDLKVEDYVRLAGGFAWRAEEGDVRVIRANTGEWVEADDVENLYPGDTIWIPEDPPGPKFWDIFTTSLTILGQVAAVVAAVVAVIAVSR